MEAAREELCKTKAELGIISVELNLKREEKDRVSAQVNSCVVSTVAAYRFLPSRQPIKVLMGQ